MAGAENHGRRLALLPVPVSAAGLGVSRSSGLSPVLQEVLRQARQELGAALVEGQTAGSELEQVVTSSSERLGIKLTVLERDLVVGELEKESRPFGPLEPLVNDVAVSDIIITSHDKVNVQQGRRNYLTDIRFPSQADYEAFVERLLLRAGATYSTKKPVADGMLHGFARLHVVHRCLCGEGDGPYLTIRLNRYASVRSLDLIRAGLAPEELFQYLEGVVKTGRTILIVGEVGAGKTTLARALAASIPEDEAILVIEDTPEIKLDHRLVRSVVTREANTDGVGRISPAELIRAGMRMAMNRIIFGEMRDAEAAEAFIDVCASGHPGMSTIHARSAAEALTRLELFLGRAQKGVSREVLSQQMVTAVAVIVFVDVCKETGRRRIMEVKEIGPVADGRIREREMFTYRVEGGVPVWTLRQRVSAHRDGLERLERPVVLSQMADELTVDVGHEFAHVAGGRR
jgi:pilus assembly protein CpaF